jgi:hypothetical protein
LFEGPAGTGKTTRLVASAREHLDRHPLGAEQRVLALTKYHGSRRRMDVKLRGKKAGVCDALDCLTIDSFSWRILQTWRSLSDHLGLRAVPGNFGSITAAAGVLLQHANVAQWIARRYPVVIVDELQDCKAGELDVLRGIEPYATFFCGADGFQDLSGDVVNEAVDWAGEVGEVVPLHRVRRTEVQALLDAASALRARKQIQLSKQFGFEILPVRAPAQAGAALCWRIHAWRQSGQIAVISATKPGTSPFCDKVVDWASTRTSVAKHGGQAGPFPTAWESSDEQAEEEMLKGLGLAAREVTSLRCKKLAELAVGRRHSELHSWAQRQFFVLGREEVSLEEVRAEISQIVRRRRAFGPDTNWDRRVLTIHQAKNREFESVVALWPLKQPKDLERQRRLLYNAITRAKSRAMVIVEDPTGKVTTGALFAGDAQHCA